MKERITWYGKEVGGKKFLFKGMKEDPVQVLSELRNGKIQELEEMQDQDIPDLREIALLFARRRIGEEFNREQYLIRIHSFKTELDRIINLYYEQILPFGNIVIDEVHRKDPCSAFQIKSEDPLIADILMKGQQLCQLRTAIREKMESEIRSIMPNSIAIAGPDICLDMISSSRSLKKLAELPSGAIQVMGAEKALFKHKSEGTPSPKHGIIYKYPGISSIGKVKRGRVCRLIASRLSFAFRADYFGRTLDVEKIKKEIAEKMAQ